MTKYDPEDWLESFVRCMKEYLEQEFDQSVYTDSEYVGLEAFEIIAEFPGAHYDLRKMPLQKTVIHFEIDDIASSVIGLGDNIFSWTVDDITGLGTAREAQVHLLNVDVGVWATDASGGTTARMRAKQTLQNALGGARGITKMRAFSDGGDGMVEIMGYSGGRFMLDSVNDVQVFRMVESTLVVRVFSRSPADPSMVGPAIMDIEIDPHLKINQPPVVELDPQ